MDFKSNEVTLFSNGIASYVRTAELKGGQNTERVTVPVKQAHLGDLLASLMVYGDAKLVSPPSFAVGNRGESRLKIDPKSPVLTLAEGLSGAEVEVTRTGGKTETGTLVGLDIQRTPVKDSREFAERRAIVISTAEGALSRIDIDELESFRFTSEEVNTEIRKALSRNLDKIKPGTSSVVLELQSEKATEAVVQYTVPAPAWKMSFRLREVEAGKFVFESDAVVDNDTEEDWKNFIVSVVTGAPITFETDLAETRIPRRAKVNVVADRAEGNVDVEDRDRLEGIDGGEVMLAALECAGADSAPTRGVRRRAKALAFGGGAAPASLGAQAGTPEVETAAVGDFSVFTSKEPISIPGGHSALIPMFNKPLDNAGTVLMYKYESHAERPYRAVRFVNTTGQTLGRGVCCVYLRGDVYAGTCILNGAKPGEEKILPHALENGVRIHRKMERERGLIVRVAIAKGAMVTESRRSVTALHRIVNMTGECYELIVDHQRHLENSKISVDYTDAKVDDLKDGVRVSLKLQPTETLTLTIEETQILSQEFEIATDPGEAGNAGTLLLGNLLKAGHTPGDDKKLEPLRALVGQIEAATQKLAREGETVQRLETKAERLRRNLEAVGDGRHSDETGKWVVELAAIEEKIKVSEEQTQVGLQEELDKLNVKLRELLLGLTYEYKVSGDDAKAAQPQCAVEST